MVNILHEEALDLMVECAQSWSLSRALASDSMSVLTSCRESSKHMIIVILPMSCSRPAVNCLPFHLGLSCPARPCVGLTISFLELEPFQLALLRRLLVGVGRQRKSLVKKAVASEWRH